MPGDNPKPSDAKVLSTGPLENKDARWTKLVLYDIIHRINYFAHWSSNSDLKRTTYTDPTGKQRTWESAERSTRPKGSAIDGVGIVAILQKPAGPEIVLQKQFRPPINKVVIEVPAGLVDAGEGAAESAVRELKEETGYVGTVDKDGWGVGCVMFNDPGFCNTNLNMVHVNVDMSDPRNQDLKPELEENEFIEVFSTPLKDLHAECKRLEQEGYAIDARVGTLAEGIQIAKRWNL